MSRVNVSIDSQLLEAAKALLQDGESLEQFFDGAIGRAVRCRQADAVFLARGLASAEQARRTGQYVDSAHVIADLERVLQKKMSDS